MARGYEGAFGRKLNAPYVWIPLCLLFLLPFVDPRRPFRLLHLDLLVLLAFGVSHVFFNRGEIGTSVPLVYPVLLYLLGRMLLARAPAARADGTRWCRSLPVTVLVVGIVFLVGFRVGLNVTDSNVIDVGYAGVIGADRIADGDELYGDGFPRDVERGDTYGPVNYLAYVPFEQAMPWSGAWDDLPAAHGAAIAFDLLTLLGLFVLGRRLRPGAEGRTLGVALAYAWAAYPYTLFVLQTNSNDSLVALCCVAALLALHARARAGDRQRRAEGAAIALGAAAKFAPLALAPLFATPARPEARARRRPCSRSPSRLVLAVTVAPFVPDGGLREIYDRTRRLPGRPPVAVQHLGPVAVARLAADRRQGRRGGARAARGLRAAAQDAAQAGGARRRRADRAPAHRVPLVLPLHRLVHAVRRWSRCSARTSRRASLPGEQQLLDRRRPPVRSGLDQHPVQPGILFGGLEPHLRRAS